MPRVLRVPFLLSLCLLPVAPVLAETQRPPAGEKVPKVAQERPAVDSRVRPDLREELAKLKPGEFVPIIIRLKDQLPPQDRAAALAGKDKKQRRKALVTALRAHAERSQREILAATKKLEAQGLVRNVHSLWLSNVIGAEVQAQAIDVLLQFPNIEYLKPDVKPPKLLHPTWNIRKINANVVWQLTPTSYTGSGVVVAVLDGSFDLDHPDLVNRLWINAGEDIDGDGRFTAADNNGVDDDGNGYIDDVVGWDFWGNDNNPSPDLTDSAFGWSPFHGTHVAGIIAGDGSGGTATGVAPGANLMLMRFGPGLLTQPNAWQALEYALTNGADIVSTAFHISDPDYQTWRQVVDNLIDAGILFVAAAGNDNPHEPPPEGIVTPARVPRALTVGATGYAGTFQFGYIAEFSANGPTSWQSVAPYFDYIFPPGLLKPDVSAPGVNVRSTRRGGGYRDDSGTSFAAPHVSGIAALLLEKDPMLLPHELAFIIQETAFDRGSSGPDNVYGWGRVNALGAINYNYPPNPVYDLTVTGTNQVWTSIDIWVDNNDDGIPDAPVANRDNHLYARVRNIGGQAVGNVEIKFYYADVGTLGISGFDPNNDGDPDDGNFNYIDSYYVPVIGLAGSRQDTSVGVVNWRVPFPTTDHWCVGIGIVTPNPPNAPEADRTNNTAFKNFFNIELPLGGTLAFKFYIYPDPQLPDEPFDFEFERRGLPPEFEVELSVDEWLAQKWFDRMRGFERVKPYRFAEMPGDVVEKREERIRLTEDRGILSRIVVPDGKPVLARLLLRAPKRAAETAVKEAAQDQLLVINAANEGGVFGGLSVNVRLKKPKQGVAKPRTLYRIEVEDVIEAALIWQELRIKPEHVRGRFFYYYGDEKTNEQLRGFGYVPARVDPEEILTRVVRVARKGTEGALREIGVTIILREHEFWVVRATGRQLHVLSRLGYEVQELGRREPRPRQIRVVVSTASQVAEVGALRVDIYGVQRTKEGYVIGGGAFDDVIDELRARGFVVEIIPDPPGMKQ